MTRGLQRSMQDHASGHAAFYTLFETSLGLCGLAWSERGVICFQLPEEDASRTRGRIAKRFPGIVEALPPPDIQGIIADVAALLLGEARDLSAVPLDMEGVTDFDRRVYEVARSIPPGRVLTYGEVAARLGIDNARPSARRWGAIRLPSSCHAIGLSRRAASSGASRPMAAPRPSAGSSPSRTPDGTRARPSST